MKTIICGAGDVGYSIADKLSKENFEVTVIDESSQRLSKVSDTLYLKYQKKLPELDSKIIFKNSGKICIIIIIFQLMQ